MATSANRLALWLSVSGPMRASGRGVQGKSQLKYFFDPSKPTTVLTAGTPHPSSCSELGLLPGSAGTPPSSCLKASPGNRYLLALVPASFPSSLSALNQLLPFLG